MTQKWKTLEAKVDRYIEATTSPAVPVYQFVWERDPIGRPDEYTLDDGSPYMPRPEVTHLIIWQLRDPNPGDPMITVRH